MAIEFGPPLQDKDASEIMYRGGLTLYSRLRTEDVASRVDGLNVTADDPTTEHAGEPH